MEREREIRQALNSFLPAPSRPDGGSIPGRAKAEPAFGLAGRHTPSKFTFSDAQRDILNDLQHSLRKHGIDAELDDIGNGIIEALSARPSLCRGLLAAYLLDL
jgi:hypothetical protein